MCRPNNLKSCGNFPGGNNLDHNPVAGSSFDSDTGSLIRIPAHRVEGCLTEVCILLGALLFFGKPSMDYFIFRIKFDFENGFKTESNPSER